MNLKQTFTLVEIAGEYMAVPTDGSDDFKGIVRLNTSGAEVFRGLQNGLDKDQLVERLMSEYEELDSDTAKKAVEIVTSSLMAQGLLEV